MAFIVKAMELYRILEDILIHLYLSPPKGEQQETRLTHILELDGRIQRWRASLPQHLQSHSASGEDPVLQRQAVVLRVRLVILVIFIPNPDPYIDIQIAFYMCAFSYSGRPSQVIADAEALLILRRIHTTQIIQVSQM